MNETALQRLMASQKGQGNQGGKDKKIGIGTCGLIFVKDIPERISLKDKDGNKLIVKEGVLKKDTEALKYFDIKLSDDKDALLVTAKDEYFKLPKKKRPNYIAIDAERKVENSKERFPIRITIKDAFETDPSKYIKIGGPIALGLAGIATAIGGFKFGDSALSKVLGVIGAIAAIVAAPLFLWWNGYIGGEHKLEEGTGNKNEAKTKDEPEPKKTSAKNKK